MNRQVTLKDIAKIAGVDVSTVSRALNDSPLISRNVKNKIKKIAKELNYVPNLLGYSLKKKQTKTISVVVPYLEFLGGEFYNEIVRGVYNVVQANGYTVIFTAYRDSFDYFNRIVLERRIDGALFVGDIFRKRDLEIINSLGIPVVFINYKFNKKNYISVYTENIKPIEELTLHLIKHHKRNKLLFIGGGEEYQTSKLRLKGFKNIVEKEKIGHKVVNASFEKSPESSYKVILELIREKKFDFNGIVCASDGIALGVIKALQENGIKIPEEVSITGYDNTQVGRYVSPPLTSVEPGAYEMGKRGTEILLDWVIRKHKPENTEFKVKSKVVIRESCGCGRC